MNFASYASDSVKCTSICKILPSINEKSHVLERALNAILIKLVQCADFAATLDRSS